MLSADMDDASRAEDGRLADLYVRYGQGAVRLAYLLTGDAQLAEDLVQDAFVKLAGRLAHLRDPDTFAAYLRRTVINLANSHYRRTRVERRYAAGQGPPPELTWDDERMDDREDVWLLLQGLPPRQRAAIVLRFYEDLPERRIAEVLRCRAGTVRSLVSRGLKTLRQAVEARSEVRDD